MDWFITYVKFSMEFGFWHWLGCYLLLMSPFATAAAIISVVIEKVGRR